MTRYASHSASTHTAAHCGRRKAPRALRLLTGSRVGWPAVILLAACALAGTALCAASYGRAGVKPVDSTSTCAYSDARGRLSDGPWGRLVWRRTTITPPNAAVTALTKDAPAPRWRFPNTSRHELANFLAELPVTDDVFNALLVATVAEPSIDGFTIKPGADLLRQIPPAARVTLYDRLGASPLNRQQINALRCWSDSPRAWFRATGLDPALWPRIEPYVYQRGHFAFLADYGPALKAMDDDDDRLTLVRSLASEDTLTLHLKIAEGQPIEPLVTYWGRHGRAAAVRARLERAANTPGGARVDVAELLPPFARQRLATYPRRQKALGVGRSRDCHWSALNFFSTTPDDRYADASYVQRALEHDYVRVQTPRFGDLVVFVEGDQIYHTAVHIADDIIFTKNGSRRSRPWMLLPMCVMKDFYPREGVIEVVYLRRESAAGGAGNMPVAP